MKNLLVAGLFALSLTGAPAAAATFINVGDSYTFNFDGKVDPVGVVSGLTSSLTLTVFSVGATSMTFNYSLENTSSGGVTTSRVSRFGFDVSPDVTSATATGAFTVTSLGDDFPNVGGINRIMDVCVEAQVQGNCGGGPGGVTLGNTGVGQLILNFAGAPGAVTIDDAHVRYQSITAPGIQDGSGVGDEVGIVPEPATWAMLIAGFGVVGSAMRRRRGLASVNA